MFNPIWNPNILPIKFIIKIRIPPITEFAIIFIIYLIGNIKNFPNINKQMTHAK